MSVFMNYQKELSKLIESFDNRKRTLLLHSCCAPCSSYVLEYLQQYFEITVFYYNPNITDREEYDKRVKEQKQMIDMMNYPIAFIEGAYEPKRFFEMAKGFESCAEGGERCFLCYEMRMREAVKIAKEKGFDFFTTTLSISPLKNAEKINEIGQALAAEYEIKHLPSDFKKKNGYKRSVELCETYGLYRQNYCGCVYSMRECK